MDSPAAPLWHDRSPSSNFIFWAENGLQLADMASCVQIR